MYDLDCMRCKKKLSQDEAKCSNHCSICLPLVSDKWKWAIKERERIYQESDDFANGKDVLPLHLFNKISSNETTLKE